MQIITDTKTLEDACQRLANERFVTVDTEFIRERTYFPVLCLMQLGGASETFAIDALAKGLDLDPFFSLCANPKVTKVFHAGRQDLEIIFQLSGKLPAPLYDTQIAAMALGYGEQVGYENLVRQLTDGKLDKAMQVTDWAKRPLSERQILYALSDVIYLREIYEILTKKLEEKGRASWVAEEMAKLSDNALYKQDPEESWKRVKFPHAKPIQLMIIKLLAKWREEKALRKNLPRGWLLKDEAIVAIAQNPPKSVEDFDGLKRMTGSLSPDTRVELLKLTEQAKQTPESEWPRLTPRTPLPEKLSPLLDALKLLLKWTANELEVTPRLIATGDELESFAMGARELPMLHGWRKEAFGNTAIAFAEGKVKIGSDGQKLMVS